MKNNSTASQSTITNVAPFREGALFEGLKDLMILHKAKEITINPIYFEDITNLLKGGNNTEIYDRMFKNDYCRNLFSVKYYFMDEPWVYGARVFTRAFREHYFQIVKEYEEIPEGSFKLASIDILGNFSVDRITLFLQTADEIYNMFKLSRVHVSEIARNTIFQVVGSNRTLVLERGHITYNHSLQELYEEDKSRFNLFTMDRKLYEIRIPNASYAEAWACPILKVGDRVRWISVMHSRENVTYTTGTIIGIAERLTIQEDDGTISNCNFTDKNIERI